VKENETNQIANIAVAVSLFLCGTYFGWLLTNTSINLREYKSGYAEGKAYVYQSIMENDQSLEKSKVNKGIKVDVVK
jgi:hypothetical protein